MKKLGEHLFLFGLLSVMGMEYMLRPFIKGDIDRMFIAALLVAALFGIVVVGVLFVMGAMIFGR